MGTESKTAACYVTGYFLFKEINIGKEGITTIKYHLNIGATAAFLNKIMESKNELGQSNRKSATRYCFLLNSWFDSKRSDETTMDDGYSMVGMVKN